MSLMHSSSMKRFLNLADIGAVKIESPGEPRLAIGPLAHLSGSTSIGLDYLPWTQEVAGSSPASPKLWS